MIDCEHTLATWLRLNEALMQTDEETCLKLLNYEASHARRYTFLMRIQRRLNKLRAIRERKAFEIYRKDEVQDAARDD